MSFTRFHDDPHRIKKQLEESTYHGRYFLNTPGPGMDMPFSEDPHVRLQKWGANLHTNSVNLESDLYGLTRTYNRDLTNKNDYKQHQARSQTNAYRVEQPFTEESRASHPAWTYKDLEHSRWESPFLNPQNDLERKFDCNIQSRIIEKDNFQPNIPVVDSQQYYLTGPSMCIAGNEKGCFGSSIQ
jgi:hypothetical protein|uniref:Uncharacterized protein n=1 Tax=viral metagenome TaxID=1070528 RepID=A0A6C0IPK5_9ZZZZ